MPTENAKVESSTDPSASSGHSLATGKRVEATIDEEFSSRTDKAGKTVAATVSADVKDARGRVVIPSGSPVALTIETLDPGNDQIRPEGRLSLVVNSVTVNGHTYPVVADLTPVTHRMIGRGITKDEAARIGAVAVHYAYRDVVVAANTPITFTLSHALSVAAR